MSQMFRLFFAVAILLGGILVSADDAEARKFRFGGGSKKSSYSKSSSRGNSSTTVVVVPTYRSGHSYSRAQDGTGEAKADSNGIQLVYDMPNTSDYAYASGHFDIGYRADAEDTDKYVIYAGPHYMTLKPKLQGQIAERLGFDPVENHKKARSERGEVVPTSPVAVQTVAAPIATPDPVQPEAAKTDTPAPAASGSMSFLPILVFFVVLTVAGVIFMLFRGRDSGTVEVGRANMEDRVNARLQALRA